MRSRLDRRTPIDPHGLTIADVVWRVHRLAPDPSWRERAACANSDVSVFFVGEQRPDAGVGPAAEPARVMCWSCPVRWDCLHAALVNRERYGIWGGLDAHQRERIRRSYRNAYNEIVGEDNRHYVLTRSTARRDFAS